MALFPCPYLRGDAELTDERKERHPELLPEHRPLIATTLAGADQVRRSTRFGSARLFSRWYDDLRNGKHVVVVVIRAEENGRHWIVTAYIARSLAAGDIEWARS